MHTVGNAAKAERVVAAGVDVVVAQGWEAGGHIWSQVTTFAFVPRVVDVVAPHRTLCNSTVSNWEAAGSPPAPQRPNEREVIAHFADGRPIERYSDVIALPGTSGEVEALVLYAGQSAGLVSRLQPAGEIVQQLVHEAAAVLASCARLL